ncbi:hypothetical protein GSN00_10650 [Cylindrospermopsis raciborskii CHAB3438]|uniref:hypothetical protein n=1 Tax=Cylindrospermopsis raciborskii TaxID=77022 RepID=UPI001F367905|nr:hypothetical protein [Cylindrospermopsis raciborskii]MCH4904825.1 hypothetical protein [Cylindrospermopsis raciborskii CHAB3438]MEB3146252.1 hypothetical protein [Cylindrospermopsis raciborskii]UJS05761.1 hypothetical protein L3I90_05900 [Cylindrospermopsis raciborskii KLL07]
MLKPNTLSHILPDLSVEEQQLISGGGHWKKFPHHGHYRPWHRHDHRVYYYNSSCNNNCGYDDRCCD